jgi:hypothetical protein
MPETRDPNRWPAQVEVILDSLGRRRESRKTFACELSLRHHVVDSDDPTSAPGSVIIELQPVKPEVGPPVRIHIADDQADEIGAHIESLAVARKRHPAVPTYDNRPITVKR